MGSEGAFCENGVTTEITDPLWKEFEELGEMPVRQKIATGYGPLKIKSANCWLEYKVRQSASAAESRREALTLEQIRITRHAKNTAIAAAIAAMIFNAITVAITLIKFPLG